VNSCIFNRHQLKQRRRFISTKFLWTSRFPERIGFGSGANGNFPGRMFPVLIIRMLIKSDSMRSGPAKAAPG
jgi:hypothetical protein